MPVDETTVLMIVCDNPDCPGNDLDPHDRTGWSFVSHEVYGQPTGQSVFCSSTCVSAAALLSTDNPDEVFPSKEPVTATTAPPVEVPPIK